MSVGRISGGHPPDSIEGSCSMVHNAHPQPTWGRVAGKISRLSSTPMVACRPLKARLLPSQKLVHIHIGKLDRAWLVGGTRDKR